MKKLLLLHGALANEQQLTAFADRLRPDFEPILFTFPGHQHNDTWDGDFSMETFVKALDSFVQESGYTALNIFGYSMGGYAALCLASRSPQLVARIVTLGTNLFWTPELAAQHARQLNAEKIAEKVPKYAQVLEDVFGKAYWKSLLQKTSSMMQKLGEKDLLPVEILHKLTIPCTFAVADSDQMVPFEVAEQAAAELKRGSAVKIANSKHPFEQTDQNVVLKLIHHALRG